MKRITLLHLVAIAFFAVGQAVADYNNLLFTFSTRGPDYYADGKTVVKDGEWYALVWSKEADTASFDEVILAAPLAKDGRCPYTFFQIDAADTARVKTTGYYSLRLLDTRDGAGNPAKPSADGRVPAVVAKAIVAAATDAKPKLRYPAGSQTGRVHTMRRLVPSRMFDQQIRKLNELPA
jgi:hypothetical protein